MSPRPPVPRIADGCSRDPRRSAVVSRGVVAQRQTAIRLTRRQTQLLELIQSGLSSRQISTELHIAEGTVNNLVTAILQAINAGSRAHAVARAIELGFIDARPDHRHGEPLQHWGTG